MNPAYLFLVMLLLSFVGATVCSWLVSWEKRKAELQKKEDRQLVLNMVGAQECRNLIEAWLILRSVGFLVRRSGKLIVPRRFWKVEDPYRNEERRAYGGESAKAQALLTCLKSRYRRDNILHKSDEPFQPELTFIAKSLADFFYRHRRWSESRRLICEICRLDGHLARQLGLAIEKRFGGKK